MHLGQGFQKFFGKEIQIQILAAFVFDTDITHPLRAVLFQCRIGMLFCLPNLLGGDAVQKFGIVKLSFHIFPHINQRDPVDMALHLIPIKIRK